MTDSASRVSPSLGTWLGLDLLLVVVFTAIGRLSHGESLAPAGWWETTWPFAAGLFVGWAVLIGLRIPVNSLLAGAVVWPWTVLVGMLLRRISDQGTAVSFVIVATLVLGLFLLGSRLIALRVAGRQSA